MSLNEDAHAGFSAWLDSPTRTTQDFKAPTDFVAASPGAW